MIDSFRNGVRVQTRSGHALQLRLEECNVVGLVGKQTRVRLASRASTSGNPLHSAHSCFELSVNVIRLA